MIRTSNSPPRPRLLLLAFDCNPEQGSESAVGWNRVVQAAKHCDTWVICDERFSGPPVRRYLESHGPIAGLRFQFVHTQGWESLVRELPGMWYLTYERWHRRALRIARRLHDQIHFDLVHQVNYAGFREPGYLWKLDAPFVWGPVGGTQNYPWRFLGEAGIRGALSATLRSLVNNLQLRFSPRVRRAARSAAAVLVANSTVKRDFARALGVAPSLQLEVGVPQVAAAPRRWRPRREGLRILWSGELRPLDKLEDKHQIYLWILQGLSRSNLLLSCKSER